MNKLNFFIKFEVEPKNLFVLANIDFVMGQIFVRVLNILRNVGLDELIIQFITEDQWHIFGLCSRSMKWLLECLFHIKRRISSQQLNI